MSASATSVPSPAPARSEYSEAVERHHSPFAWTSFILLTTLFIVAMLFFPPFQGAANEQATPAWALFFGRFHPIAVHLPVGVLLMVAIMEVFVFVRGKAGGEALRAGQTFALGFGVFGAILAVVFGVVRSREGGFGSPTFQAHELLGVATGVGALLTFFFKVISDGTGRLTSVYRLLLLVTVAIMSVGGHFGGNLTHGSNYLVKHATPEIRNGMLYAESLVLSRFKAPEEPKTVAPGVAATTPTPTGLPPVIEPPSTAVGASPTPPAGTTAAVVADAKTGGTVYATLIAPIMAEKCNSCHDDDKSKGELRLDTHEMIMLGGGSGDNVVPGDPVASLMVERMKLPLDDDDRMPPSDEPQTTDEEVALIEWWVKQGASKDLLVIEAQIPAELNSLVEKMGVKAQGGSSGSTPPVLLAAAQGPAEATLAIAEAMKNVNGSGAILTPEQVSPAQLRFSALNIADQFDDAKMAQLSPIAEHLTMVDLSKTKITDASVAVLAKMKNLRELNLKDTKVTQAAAESLKKTNAKLVITANWSPTPAPAPAPAPKVAAAPIPAGGTGPGAGAMADAPVFNQVILPILQAKCISCHGEEKGRGKLRMHTFADLMKGGSDGETTVIAGNLKDSLMVVRAELPEDDDERMPPIDEPQLTKEEMALLKWWVEQGASETVTLAAIKKTPEIEEYLKAYAKAKPAAPKAVVEKPKPKELTEDEKKKIAVVSAKMTALSATFMPVSLETPGQMRFAAVNAADKFGDKEMAELAPIGLTVVWADFARTKITDAGLAYVAGMDNLERLHLENTGITDEGLSHLGRLTKLEYLNLYGTKVTDAGLAKLANNKGLKKLFVWQTGVTPAGAKKLEEVIPGLVVNVGLTEADVAKLIEAAKPPAPPAAAPAPTPAPAAAAKPATAAPKPAATATPAAPKPAEAPKPKPADAAPKPTPTPAPAPTATPKPADKPAPAPAPSTPPAAKPQPSEAEKPAPAPTPAAPAAAAQA
ncbi:c-type cytochrome domain-containing protein [Phragmitibacter flavus]|nr:c-type cytochrome domain-containing protein [Phragmitibacter flavus]